MNTPEFQRQLQQLQAHLKQLTLELQQIRSTLEADLDDEQRERRSYDAFLHQQLKKLLH